MTWRRRRGGADTGKTRYWEDLIARLGLPGIAVREVVRPEGGYQLHCRAGRAARRRRAVTADEIRDLGRRMGAHLRLPAGSVCVEDQPSGGTDADFVIHVRLVPGAGEPSAADPVVYITDRKADGGPVTWPPVRD